MEEIDRFAKEGVYRVLVGNKSDLEEARKVPYNKGKEFADHYGIDFLEASAKNSTNIDKLFVDIAKELVAKHLDKEKLIKQGVGIVGTGIPISLSTKLNNKKKRKKKCCGKK